MDHYPQNAPIQTGPQGPLISCVAPVYGTKLKYVRVFVQSVQAKTLLLSCNYVNHLVAVRQSLMNKLEGAWTDRVNGTQDWDFLYRITPLANCVHHIPIVLYHWRAREGSVATGAKPWAQKASLELQKEELQRRCPAVHWATVEDNGPPVIQSNQGMVPIFYCFVLLVMRRKKVVSIRIRIILLTTER